MSFGKIIRHRYMPYAIKKAFDMVKLLGQRFDDNFRLDPDCRDCYEQLIRYFHGDPDFSQDLTKGIAILGNTGTGKTLAIAIMKQYRNIDNIKYTQNGTLINFDYMIASTEMICKTYETLGSEGLYKYFNRNILCIDDIGIEPKENIYYGNRKNVIDKLLHHRYENNKLTFITSNLPLDALHEFYGDRLFSRFHEMFNFIYLTGNDRRVK